MSTRTASMEKHISARFDRDFSALASRVMALGGLVEAQARHAVQALMEDDGCGAQAVLDTECLVDQLELQIDRELASAFSRRQPKASELRLLTAMARTTSDLERVGDEAERIARSAQSLGARPSGGEPVLRSELSTAADLATGQLRRALDAFARLDTGDAVAVLRADIALDLEFVRFMASVTTRMTAQPHCVAAGVDLVLVARAIERIGDHAKNIAECIIYIVEGTDLRHADAETLRHAGAGAAGTRRGH